jgi:hypothetical protein
MKVDTHNLSCLDLLFNFQTGHQLFIMYQNCKLFQTSHETFIMHII